MTHDRRFLLAGGLCMALWPGKALTMDLPLAAQEWNYVADTVMGGVSTGQASWDEAGGRRALRLTGSVSTANNGGFIQMRMSLATPLADTAEGLDLTVRGNGERYFVHLRTTATRLPWQYYQAPFDTTSDWRTQRVPFTAFARSGAGLPARVAPGDIRSIGLVAFGRDHEADLWLGGLSVY